MPLSIQVPRVNNNDDSVRVARMLVRTGQKIRARDPIAEVVTEKAAFVVEADCDGYVLGVCAEDGQMADVGSVLAWVGESPFDTLPQDAGAGAGAAPALTLKAQMRLAACGLDARGIPSSGSRISAADVERYARTQGMAAPPRMMADGRREPLTPEARAMLRTTSWHKSDAVAAYVELPYDESSWAASAEMFQDAHGLLFNPLLSLMTWWLAHIVNRRAFVNATIVDGERHRYDHVNVGFTVQTASSLYLVVVHEAEALAPLTFVHRLIDLQRKAMADAVGVDDIARATIAFTSMARWRVSRHVPVLPPYTSLAVAHSARAGEAHMLGASYDHRLLTGGDVAAVLQELAIPPSREVLLGQ